MKYFWLPKYFRPKPINKKQAPAKNLENHTCWFTTNTTPRVVWCGNTDHCINDCLFSLNGKIQTLLFNGHKCVRIPFGNNFTQFTYCGNKICTHQKTA